LIRPLERWQADLRERICKLIVNSTLLNWLVSPLLPRVRLTIAGTITRFVLSAWTRLASTLLRRI
jgi:hypothetical protein